MHDPAGDVFLVMRSSFETNERAVAKRADPFVFQRYHLLDDLAVYRTLDIPRIATAKLNAPPSRVTDRFK
jgi:ABC-type lipoprotein export system ATPase subunit